MSTRLPPLPVSPIVGWHNVQIGEFYIGRVHDGYWIEHESGEGMHVRGPVMEKLIADFYKENF